MEIKNVPIVKVDEEMQYVFGWANVPHPVSKSISKAYLGHQVEGSVEDFINRVEHAYFHVFSRHFDSSYADVMATFDDFLIIRVESYESGESTTFWTISFVETDGEFEFGDFVGVKMEFVEKKMGHFFKEFTPKVDRQGDMIEMVDLEKGAYDFVLHSRMADADHERLAGEMIESFVVTDEKLEAMGFSEDARAEVNKGWWIGFHVDDDAWALVKDGTYNMFSIFGQATSTEIE